MNSANAEQDVDIGYIDILLDLLRESDPDASAAFGRHVHWGYWSDANSADGTGNDYASAAEALTRLVCDAAGITDGMKVLDVGCGFGGTIASLNERFSNLQLVGLNIDERQLQRAEGCVHARESNSIEWVHGDACKLPFDEGGFDAILAVECIFHFPSRQKFFGEARRVLNSGGRLALSDFVPQTLTLPLLRILNAFAANDIRYAYGETDIFATLRTYGRLARQNNLMSLGTTDITRNTLPTYEFLLTLLENCPDQFDRRRFVKATEALKHGAKSGLVRYRLLSFQKPVAQ